MIDRLKKLLALAERGQRGEADNARRLLEAELRRHGLTLDDICSEKRTERTFKYGSLEERDLIVQILLNYLGSTSEAFNISSFSARKKEIYIGLTDMEYIDISNMCAFYVKQYRIERKRLLHDMILAFVQKHNLFDSTPQERPDDDIEFDLDKLMCIMNLSHAMEDVTYRKSLLSDNVKTKN